MRAVLAWLTDAALADSILGDLEERRRVLGTLWFWRALAAVTGYVALKRLAELAGGHPVNRGNIAGQALRALRRRPGFACCTILLLALGIGVNTAVFSVVRAVLLRPLPYTDPDRLVFIWGELGTRPGNEHSVMSGAYVAGIAQSVAPLASFAVVEPWDATVTAQVDLVTADGADRLRGAWVTPNFFETLGASAARGRALSSPDGDEKVVVISDALWRRRFGSDPQIVGRTVPLATGSRGRAWSPFTIVGVLPPDFRFSYPRETEIYLPRAWRDIRPNSGLTYYVVARLGPGVSAAQAQAALTTVARRVVSGYGWEPQVLDRAIRKAGMLVEPVSEHLQAEVRPGLLLLSGVAALVLLIACVNLGLMLIARTVDRRSELAVRAALGASRARVVEQLAAECLIISIAGTALGVAAAMLAQPAIRALMPPVVPRADQIRIDPGVIAFAAVMLIVTALVSALGPALLVLRGDLLSSLRAATRGTTGDRGVIATRRSILVVQVAVVMLLLVASGLLLRSFWGLQHVELGFHAEGVVTMELFLLDPKYRKEDRVQAFAGDLLARVRAMPGVARAALTTAVPMRGSDSTMVVGPAGQPRKPGNVRSVDPRFFEIMNLPLRAGRLLTADDTAAADPVVVVSESYGRQYFGSGSPVGRALRIDDRDVTIVGVVSDVRYDNPSRAAFPAFYRPFAQAPAWSFGLVVEPQPGMREAVAAGLRDTVRALDPTQPVEGITTIDQILSDSTADRRFYAVSTGAFSFVALALAIAGVFGVVARTVSERRRELAIRLALGAQPHRLLRLVYGYGLLPAAAGIAIGLSIALAGSRLLESFLFQIAPTDAATYAGAAALVLAVTAAACYLPARRTLRVPPMLVLKTD